MDEMLTWAEIEERFPDEWVVIDQPQLTDELDITGGRVVHHGIDRDQAELEATRNCLKFYTVWYIGERIPEGTVVIL